MTDAGWLFIELFPINIPIFDSVALRNGLFYEFGHLLRSARRIRPDEPEQVEPSLKIPPFEARVVS